MKASKRAPSERSKLRRAQILDAAKHCFARVGFHSTSMAQIAAQAQMSVGQIYRHFRSKEALIEGIVQADIAQQLSFLEGAPVQRLLDALAAGPSELHGAGSLADRSYLALMLEIVAEAARNPKVREIVISSQRHGHLTIKKRIEQETPGLWPPGELDLRLRLISALSQGVATQMLLDRRAPSAALLRHVRQLAKRLLTFEGGNEPSPQPGSTGCGEDRPTVERPPHRG